MNRINNIVKVMAVTAITFLGIALLPSCKKEEASDSKKSTLQIFWGKESYTVEAGKSETMAFTVVGAEGAALTVTAECSDESISCTKKWNADYTGHVTITAPDIVTAKKNVTVSLTVTDASYGRTVTEKMPVTINKSEDLSLNLAADIRSLAVKAGQTFTIPVAVGGLASAKITSKTITCIPSTWSAQLTVSGNSGSIYVTAPASVTNQVTFEAAITDDHNRSASLLKNFNVDEITEAAGASNCHIAAPGSTITIKGVKGNSSTKLDFDNAGLVWQDAPGLVKSVSGNGVEGVVVVKLNVGVSGNAVVCARKDTAVVWSWHVWVTDYNPSVNPFVYVDSTATPLTTYTFMNRNLGAMSDKKYSDDCLGTFYQWGRKDAFPGAKGSLDNVQASVYDIDGKQIWMTKTTRPVYDDHTTTNLGLAIANPFVFYGAPSSAWPVVDWLTDEASLQNDDLWGGKSGLKSIYDPCPEGWEMPTMSAYNFRNRYKKDGKLTDSGRYDSSYPWFIEYDDDKCIGFRYKEYGCIDEYWFPFTGKLDVNTGDITGVGGGADYYTRDTQGNLCGNAMLAWGNPNSVSYLNRSYGFPVRCVRQDK